MQKLSKLSTKISIFVLPLFISLMSVAKDMNNLREERVNINLLILDSLITGKVTSVEDGKPVAGVIVSNINKRKKTIRTETDVNGNYKIIALPNDRLSFTNNTGHAPSVVVSNEKVVNVKIQTDNGDSAEIGDPPTLEEIKKQETLPILNESDILTSVEQNAEFPGGIKEMYGFIYKNLKYPLAAQTAKISGIVFVRFVVERDGTLSNFQILKGLGSGCEEEVVTLLKSMPKWKGGLQDGKVVRCYYSLPIKFNYEEKK